MGKLILGNVIYPGQADTQSHYHLSLWKGRSGKGRRNSQESLFCLHLLLLTSSLAELWHCPVVSGQRCIDLADFLPCSGNTANWNNASNATKRGRKEHNSKLLPPLISQPCFPALFKPWMMLFPLSPPYHLH